MILVSAYGAGIGLLKITKLHNEPAIRYVKELLSVTLGLGILAYSILGIGLLRLLHPLIVWGILTLFTFIGIFISKEESIFKSFEKLKKIPSLFYNLDSFNKFLVVTFLIFVFFNLIGALAPPLAIDDIKYHLAIPNRYVNERAITYIPDFHWSNLPFTMEMLWTLAISINTGELAQLINWSIGILIIGWIFYMCKKKGVNTNNSLFAINLFYSTSTVTEISQTGSVELGGTMFFISGFFLISSTRKILQYKYIIISGILFGFYFGCKLPNLLMLFPLIIWLMLICSNNKYKFHTTISYNIIFSFVSIIVVGVWYLKSYIMTGNPFFPFLPSIFDGPINGILSHSEDSLDPSLLTLKEIPWSYFSSLKILLTSPENFRGHISPLFVSCIPLLLINRKKIFNQNNYTLFLIISFYIFCVSFYPFIRTALPLIAILVIPVSLSFYIYIKHNKYIKYLINFLIIAWITISFIIQLRLIIPKLPVVSGFKNKEWFLTNISTSNRYKFHNYKSHKFINDNLPIHSVVLLWSNDGYYLDRNYLYAIGFLENMVDTSRIYNPELVISELKEYGITHVAMNDDYLRKKLKETLISSNRLKLLYQDKNMIVASLL